MTSTHDSLSPDTRNRPGINAGLRTGATVLPEADHRQLRRHLERCQQARHRAWGLLAYVLRDKIMKTEPVPGLFLRDLVTGGARVSYSVDGGQVRTGLLVHRARTGSGSGVIPVASLLGATLIGMRIGDRAPLLHEDGAVGTLSVLDVAPPN